MSKEKKQFEVKPVVGRVLQMYKEAQSAKQPLYSQWKDNYKAYNGSMFKRNATDTTRANAVPNHIFSTVETIKPIMMTNQPKNLVVPTSPDSFEKSQLVQNALDYEWKRTHLLTKIQENINNESVYGTQIMGLFWNAKASKGIGQIEPIVIPCFNFFIDPLATSIDSAEYCGYATYKPYGELAKAYPDKSDELENSCTNDLDENLTFGKDTQNAKRQLLYIECYFRDYSYEIIEDENEDGEKVKKSKGNYPNGRRVIIAGDVLLFDGENPYEDGRFPFVANRCYDVTGSFWGMSEVEQLISVQKEICSLYDDIIDNAHLCGNPIWIMDKNCGVEKNSVTNTKGLIIRKNPGTEVKRDAPPPIPAYIQNIVSDLKYDIQVISGVFDATRGERPVSITSGVAIQALQESSQGRIRLRTQKLEYMLSELGSMWLSRMQQFWVLPRTIRIMGGEYARDTAQVIIEGQPVAFQDVSRDEIDGDFDIEVKAGSTMPSNKSARMEQLLRLAQTPAEDGMPVIDRRTLLEYSEIDNVMDVIRRFEDRSQMQQQAEMEQAQMQQQAEMERQAQQMQMAQENEMAKQQMQYENSMSEKQMDIEGKIALQKEGKDLQSEVKEFDEDMTIEEFIALIQSMNEQELREYFKKYPKALLLLQKLQQQFQTQGVQPQGIEDTQGGIM